jgi:hypothetical protein
MAGRPQAGRRLWAAAVAAAGGDSLGVSQLTPAGAWRQTGVVSVPVQLGSSS